MSNIIFPSGYIVDYLNFDLEMFKYRVSEWDLESDQLGKGELRVSLRVVHTPRIQLANTQITQAYMSQGSFPDGGIMLLYVSSKSIINLQNRSTEPREVIIFSKGDEVDFLTSASIDAFTVVIEEELFYKEFYAFFGDTPDVLLQKKRFYLKEDKVLLYQQTVTSWISYLAKEFPKLTIKPEYGRMESEIVRQLFDCMVPAPFLKKREKFQTKAVRDLLQENIDQYIDISFMIKELDISESQLHQAFKKEYGITPKRYLNLLRFNAIKKELLSSDPDSITIANIARKYNFFEMGHFSAQYKKIFGEAPSQTLHHNKGPL